MVTKAVIYGISNTVFAQRYQLKKDSFKVLDHFELFFQRMHHIISKQYELIWLFDLILSLFFVHQN